MKWILPLLGRVGQFVRRDRSRFVWEIVIAVVVWGIGYGLNWLVSQKTLQTCQDERTALLREIRRAQSVQDSLKYRSQLLEKDHIIFQKDETIIKLRERAARDSVYQRSLLQSIQRLNEYVEKGRKLF